MATNFIATIGMEVHAQLKTNSKMFCSCSAAFGDQPNTHLCPICLGLPGSLPSVNRRAVVLGLKAAKALQCTILPFAQFARKNYFYPDLPKGYQISMYQFPLGIDGRMELLDERDEKTASVGIERVHLEEDTAKLFHEGTSGCLIDFNRAGVPLLEIVSKPVIKSAREAVSYLKELRRLLRFLGISDANMEEGSFRCEVNISVRPEDREELGTRVEIKNLNSFRAVERSIDFEIKRQTNVCRGGGFIRGETLGWDEKEGKTVHQRFKEKPQEYRYFPEPDLPDLVLEGDIMSDSAFNLEKIPVCKVRSLIERFGVPPFAADLLMSGTGSPVDNPYYVAEFFVEAVDKYKAQGTQAANLMTQTVFEYINKSGHTLDQTSLTPEDLAKVTRMVADEDLSITNAKHVISLILEQGGSAESIIKREGMIQVSDDDELVKLVREVISENEHIAESVRRGKDAAIGALVGAAMKKSGGQANPKRLNEIFKEQIFRRKN